jgi:hypothetical protein
VDRAPRRRLIVPRRADHGWRDRLWKFCRAQWALHLPELEIIEGHDNDGPFNRGAAINRGADGEWDVAVIADADIAIDPHLVTAAIADAGSGGRVVLPFQRRLLVNEAGTQRILDGYRGSWRQWAKADRNRGHASSCIIVPRSAWEAIGGFDERFSGWGAEDDAFWLLCERLVGTSRLPGDVWHLHHAPSPEANTSTPEYRRNLGLLRRYQVDHTVTLAERAHVAAHGDIAICILTNGRRRQILADTVASADANLKGQVTRRIILADRCNPRFPRWQTIPIEGGNFRRAMSAATTIACSLPEPWLFWLEDDFTFNEPIPLDEMRDAMGPNVLQMSLVRQPWYHAEVNAGGIREQSPEQFSDMGGWLAHRWYWTCNPMLCRADIFARHPWPQVPLSERAFGHQVFVDPDAVSGVWGGMDSPPKVHHNGARRAGTGY